MIEATYLDVSHVRRCSRCYCEAYDHEPLVGCEERIRKVFPDAVWMPWDAPPVGQAVLYNGKRATVLRRWECLEPLYHVPHCGTCTCPAAPLVPDSLHGWWEVLVEAPDGFRIGGPSAAIVYGYTALEWPPDLEVAP